MPIPVAIVWGGAVAVVAIVGGVVAHEDYSDYSDHSKYSDAEARRKREEAAREKERKKNLQLARQEMDKTLEYVRTALADKAGPKGRAIFDQWNVSASDFPYENFAAEYAKLDAEVQDRISHAVSQVFDEEERARQAELDDINALLRRIAEKKLTEN